jgi:hypothetical protein
MPPLVQMMFQKFGEWWVREVPPIVQRALLGSTILTTIAAWLNRITHRFFDSPVEFALWASHIVLAAGIALPVISIFIWVFTRRRD